MESLSIVGLGLGVAFGFLLILLVAEICYFLCWKKRTSHTDSEEDTNINGKQLFQMFCEGERSGFNDDDGPEGQVQSLTVCSYSQQSPRFLFTIEEGIKEGSESESVNTKSSCRVSPCDSFIVETPYFTPLASTSPCIASPLALPLGLNPHFESANNDSAEFNRVKSSTTTPTRFKFNLQHTGRNLVENSKESGKGTKR